MKKCISLCPKCECVIRSSLDGGAPMKKAPSVGRPRAKIRKSAPGQKRTSRRARYGPQAALEDHSSAHKYQRNQLVARPRLWLRRVVDHSSRGLPPTFGHAERKRDVFI